VSVGVDADPDGTGRVRAAAALDADAVERLVGEAAGDPATVDPATRIKLDDLRDAGWTVTGPEPTDDGGLEVVVTQRFADAAEARRLLAEVGGDPGPFRDVSLAQTRSFFKTRTDFAGTIDLDAGLGAFTDPELRAALEATDDAPLGITTAQLEERLGAAIDRMFGLQVAVRLPGRVTSNAPTETDNGAVWAPSLGEEVVLEASSERWNVANIVALAAAILSAVALVVVLVARRRPRLERDASDDEATEAAARTPA
jgi:hypothetical protein